MGTPSLRVVAESGSRLGRYELVELLERDGIASVWLARSQRSEARAARVVVLEQRVAMQLELRSAFLAEARACESVRHPRFMRVLDVGSFGAGAYLATAFPQMTTLGTLMSSSQRRGAPLPPPVVLRILHDLLEPLSYMHATPLDVGSSATLVHGDLTPSHILVGLDGRSYLLSSCLGMVACSSPSDDVVGRLAYKAPEQLQHAAGAAKVDGRADQFALGTIAWSALTGKRPFVADDAVGLVRAILTCALPALEEAKASIPLSALAIAERLLAGDAGARYSDIGELARALEIVAGGELAELSQVARTVERLVGSELREQRADLELRFGAEPDSEDHALPLPIAAPEPAPSPQRALTPDCGPARSITPLSTPMFRAGWREPGLSFSLGQHGGNGQQEPANVPYSERFVPPEPAKIGSSEIIARRHITANEPSPVSSVPLPDLHAVLERLVPSASGTESIPATRPSAALDETMKTTDSDPKSERAVDSSDIAVRGQSASSRDEKSATGLADDVAVDANDIVVTRPSEDNATLAAAAARSAVDSSDIADRAIDSSDIADRAIDSSDIDEPAIDSTDIIEPALVVSSTGPGGEAVDSDDLIDSALPVSSSELTPASESKAQPSPVERAPSGSPHKEPSNTTAVSGVSRPPPTRRSASGAPESRSDPTRTMVTTPPKRSRRRPSQPQPPVDTTNRPKWLGWAALVIMLIVLVIVLATRPPGTDEAAQPEAAEAEREVIPSEPPPVNPEPPPTAEPASAPPPALSATLSPQVTPEPPKTPPVERATVQDAKRPPAAPAEQRPARSEPRRAVDVQKPAAPPSETPTAAAEPAPKAQPKPVPKPPDDGMLDGI